MLLKKGLEVVDANVLYRSLLGSASPEPISGSLVGDGDHSIKGPAAIWHSDTLGRTAGPKSVRAGQRRARCIHLNQTSASE